MNTKEEKSNSKMNSFRTSITDLFRLPYNNPKNTKDESMKSSNIPKEDTLKHNKHYFNENKKFKGSKSFYSLNQYDFNKNLSPIKKETNEPNPQFEFQITKSISLNNQLITTKRENEVLYQKLQEAITKLNQFDDRRLFRSLSEDHKFKSKNQYFLPMSEYPHSLNNFDLDDEKKFKVLLDRISFLEVKLETYESAQPLLEKIKNYLPENNYKPSSVNQVLSDYGIYNENRDQYPTDVLACLENTIKKSISFESELNNLFLFTTALLNNNEFIESEKKRNSENVINLTASLRNEEQRYSELLHTWKNANNQFIEQNMSMNNQLELLNNQLSEYKELCEQLKKNNLPKGDSLVSVDSKTFKLEEDKKILLAELNRIKFENVNLNESLSRYKLQILELQSDIEKKTKLQSLKIDKLEKDYKQINELVILNRKKYEVVSKKIGNNTIEDIFDNDINEQSTTFVHLKDLTFHGDNKNQNIEDV